MKDTSLQDPTFEDVVETHARIAGYVHETPVHTSEQLDALVGAQVHLKCENLQRVGAFKIRGATNFLSRLTAEERARGVVAHSSGNHAQAVALAARLFDTTAQIVMPEDAPAVKVSATRDYGAEVILCGPTVAAREEAADRVVAETGGTLVHPYDHPYTIMGQGTAGLEFMRQSPNLDVLIVPVSGGGLISGVSLAAHGIDPGIRILGVEPETAADAKASLDSGTLVQTAAGKTLADGLKANLSERTLRLLRAHVEDILVVTEAALREATLYLAERLKLVAEPSGAAPLAALLTHREIFAGLRVGLLISGGNWDVRAAAASWAP
jgi:threonine dehydratase